MSEYEKAKEYLHDIAIAFEKNVHPWLYPSDFLQAANAVLHNSHDIHMTTIDLIKWYLLMKAFAPTRPFAPKVKEMMVLILFHDDLLFPPKMFRDLLDEFVTVLRAHHYDEQYVRDVYDAAVHYYSTGKIREDFAYNYAINKLAMAENAIQQLAQENPLRFVNLDMFDLSDEEKRRVADEVWGEIKKSQEPTYQ